jgi:Secretion system C-terminal sorting domain
MITTTKIYLVLSTMLLSITSFAQTIQWPQTGSEWHYKKWYFLANTPRGFQHYVYVQDTLINNVNFKQVKGEEQMNTTVFTGTVGSTVVNDTTTLPDYLFHTSNDSVFLLTASGNLQFVWRTNPVVGEIWNYGLQYDFSSGTSLPAYCQVDSIKTVSINGYPSKDIYTHACKDINGTPITFIGDTAFYVPFAEIINTTFGPHRGFDFIGQFLTALFINEVIPNEIICFESDSVSFYQYNSNINCVNNITTGIENNIAAIIEKLIVYPNPAHSELRIKKEGLRINEVKIYNVLGECVFNLSIKQLDNVTIDVSSLLSGIYILEATTTKGAMRKKFVKQ